jgi:hypothetical protein
MAHVSLIEYSADDFEFPSTSAPQRDVIQTRPVLAFDGSAVETAYSKPVIMPGQYAGGTLNADIALHMASATSGKVDFEVSVEAVTTGDAFDLDGGTSFDSANASNDTVPGTAGYLKKLTVTLTSKDSVAAGDLFRIKLERDADDGTDDTAAGDARVVAVEIWEETA